VLVQILLIHQSLVRALREPEVVAFARPSIETIATAPRRLAPRSHFAGHATGGVEVGLRVGRYVFGPMAAGPHSHYTRSYTL
jgi:hypothetical protein